MARRSTRKRTYSKTKRSKNKFIKSFSYAANVAQTHSLSLYKATYPCTISGLRWDLVWGWGDETKQNTWNIQITWCIYIKEEGEADRTPAFHPNTTDDAGDYIKGEQSIIAWGNACVADKGAFPINQDSTKSMRKLQSGDQLMITIKQQYTGDAANAPGYAVLGGIQFFTLI